MSIYPKSNGCAVSFDEYNCANSITSAIKSNLEIELENSINIVKLQFCKSLTDTPHDYVVIDSFTDSTGWNNTIQTCCTTSTYCSSALTGNYSNTYSVNTYLTCIVCQCGCCSGSGGASATCMGYGLSDNNGAANPPSNYWACLCTNTVPCLANIKTLCFFGLCVNEITTTGSGTATAVQCVSGSHDDFCRATNGVPSCCSTTNCYCYVCLSANCWCFYCNGAGKCQVTMTTFPKLCFCGNVSEDASTNQVQASVQICYYGFCCLLSTNTKITTVSVTWDSPIKMVYYTDEVYGAGTRIYNVINATTGLCIACNIPTNCLCLLSCCVCCHKYEIIQCSDAVSCIKSYAIAVGK